MPVALKGMQFADGCTPFLLNYFTTMKKFLTFIFIASALSFGFISCSNDDDDNSPKNNEKQIVDESDYSKVIAGFWENEKNEYETISFDSKTKMVGYEMMSEDEVYTVGANGTYTLTKDKITINYTEVDVYEPDGLGVKPSSYQGFSHGKSKTVVYTILSCESKKLSLKDESGKTITFKKYKEME